MNLGSQFQAKDEGHTRRQDGERVAAYSSMPPEFTRTVRKNSNGTIYKLLVAFVLCFAFVLLTSPQISRADDKVKETLEKVEEAKEAKSALEEKYKRLEKKDGAFDTAYNECTKKKKDEEFQVDCDLFEKQLGKIEKDEEGIDIKDFREKVENISEDDIKEIKDTLQDVKGEIKSLKKLKEDIKEDIKQRITTKSKAREIKKAIEKELNRNISNWTEDDWTVFSIRVYKAIKEDIKELDRKKKKLNDADRDIKTLGNNIKDFNKRLKNFRDKLKEMRCKDCCVKKEVGAISAAPPRFYTTTFSAIEKGESVEIPPGLLTGRRATVTFVATADGSPIEGPKTELTKTKTCGTIVGFLEGLSPLITAVVIDDKGNQVSISPIGGKSPLAPEELQPAFEGPVPVTDGSMDATVSVPSGERIVDGTITDEGAESATAEVEAYKRSESGIIEETAVTASGIPSEACADGSLGFELVTEDNRTIETQIDAFYIGYSMQKITHVGQTAPVKAKITGLGDDQVLSFTFVPDVARHGISPLTNQLTVGEINSGAPITSVTSKVVGEHAFDIVVKVAPPSEERLVP